MILFASMTYTFSVQASDCCLPHNCAASQDAGGDCHDNGSDTSNTVDNCPDCCANHHGSSGVLGMKTSEASPESACEVIASGDTSLRGHDPSGLLKPPRNV